MKLPSFLPILTLPLLVSSAFAADDHPVGGKRAPATTPALPPDEAREKFSVPDGFQVRLFAAEPDVVNPVAMTWDTQGRLWVVELYEYPMGAEPGTKPRDQIKILEDTDGDERADKVTVFADGLNLATGILLGNGGAYVGQAPHLLFLKDTDGDDVADTREVVMTGFGLEDRHELLNGFNWGPDGYLYMTHGVFTYSQVKAPDQPEEADAVAMDAAVARFHPQTKKFEVFADGTSNPWGVDFDRFGNAFVSACVIDHLFHMAPGGLYSRQAGSPPYPYAYELLPSIVDHRHFRAAYAGVQVYQGHQYPEDYKGTIFMGNIHDNAVHQDQLHPVGSGFKASFVKDFLTSEDGWFRPVSQQVGPDGALWIMDWYDKFPCYQNAQAEPEGVDRTHGRIWRVVHTANNPDQPVPTRPDNLNLANASGSTLVQTLEHPNIWHRKMARRLLWERKDPATQSELEQLLADSDQIKARLEALWSLHGAQLLTESILDQYAQDPHRAIRTWVARLTGERASPSRRALSRLEKLASDPHPHVRQAVAAAARQFVSGSLTVNTPVPWDVSQINTGPILAQIIETSAQDNDPVIPFLVWMAAEPKVAADPQTALAWLRQNGEATLPLSAELSYKVMRRLCDTRNGDNITLAVDFLHRVAEDTPQLAIHAMQGLLDGQEAEPLPPNQPVSTQLAQLARHPNPDVVSLARKLGALWGDPAAFEQLLNTAQNPDAPLQDRTEAVRLLSQLPHDTARETFQTLAQPSSPAKLASEAIRALGEVGGENVPQLLLNHWNDYDLSLRRTAAEVLASRSQWALELLDALDRETVPLSDIPLTVVRSLGRSGTEAVAAKARDVIGQIRPPDSDKQALIQEKRKVALSGEPDIEAGRAVAEQACLVCHKLHGKGQEVGPDLTGVGRSNLDALLSHIIDPNQIIGKGYENVTVETTDGRSFSGRLIEDTDNRIRLLMIGGNEITLARSNIENMHVSDMSVMPEGLEQMPDEDFRNMIWFLLNPPEDERPMTPELRQALIGEQ